MAYVLPDPADIRERFPAITVAKATDAVLEALILEAQSYVDESWFERDYQPAIMYLVAHWATTGGAASAGMGVIQSESFGPMSRTFAQGAGGVVSEYSSTDYGRHYESLLRRNRGGPLVV